MARPLPLFYSNLNLPYSRPLNYKLLRTTLTHSLVQHRVPVEARINRKHSDTKWHGSPPNHTPQCLCFYLDVVYWISGLRPALRLAFEWPRRRSAPFCLLSKVPRFFVYSWLNVPRFLFRAVPRATIE